MCFGGWTLDRGKCRGTSGGLQGDFKGTARGAFPPPSPPRAAASIRSYDPITTAGSQGRTIKTSKAPKGRKNEIQHAMGQGPGEF